ncbi:MAG: hypothetical protein V7L26_22195 [Nostoc sp.]|uniref:hypothetical protein n=1 Tax=Nostoc sp. TaxID=1180 RepID=UPI002FF7FB57
MANNTDNGASCLVRFFGFLVVSFLVKSIGFSGVLALLILGFFAYVAVVIIVSIVKAIIKLFQPLSTANTSSSTTNTNSASINFTVSPDIPDDLDNILRELSNGEIKDPVTQDIFCSGEKVYLCHVHRLAYHEDSWIEIGRKCMVCGNATHTKTHVLSPPVQVRRMDVIQSIEFRDIE